MEISLITSRGRFDMANKDTSNGLSNLTGLSYSTGLRNPKIFLRPAGDCPVSPVRFSLKACASAQLGPVQSQKGVPEKAVKAKPVSCFSLY